MKHSAILLLAIAALLIPTAVARAWLRARHEDAQVVARSELIVVGAIKPGSIVYVPHEKEPSGAQSWENHATLIVRQVLKGKCDEKEIPIIIHYGLEPMVKGQAKHEGLKTDGPVEIWDDGNSEHSGDPIVADARQDNIWLLRRLGGEYGENAGSGNLGIADPEDLQPLVMKEYFNCYLSKDPESAVRAQLQKQPDIASRATRYLEHLAVERVLAEPDPAKRVEDLLPFYLSRQSWGYHYEARDAIVKAGAVAGPYLLGIYSESREPRVQGDVIMLYGQIRYGGCVDLLIDVLKHDDEFWSRQDLKPGWWNQDVDSARTRILREKYGEVFNAVCTLGEIGDPRAKDAVELTRKRWLAIHFENPQIVEACEKAISAFDAK